MKERTYSEARQRLATLIEQARREDAVRIRRKGNAWADRGRIQSSPHRLTPL